MHVSPLDSGRWIVRHDGNINGKIFDTEDGAVKFAKSKDVAKIFVHKKDGRISKSVDPSQEAAG